MCPAPRRNYCNTRRRKFAVASSTRITVKGRSTVSPVFTLVERASEPAIARHRAYLAGNTAARSLPMTVCSVNSRGAAAARALLRARAGTAAEIADKGKSRAWRSMQAAEAGRENPPGQKGSTEKEGALLMRLSARQKGVLTSTAFSGGEERGDAHAMHVRGEAFIEREASLVVSRRFSTSTWGRCCLPRKTCPGGVRSSDPAGGYVLYMAGDRLVTRPHLV